MKSTVNYICLIFILSLIPFKIYGQNGIMLEPKAILSKNIKNIELTSEINAHILYAKDKTYKYNKIYKNEFHFTANYKISLKQKAAIEYSLVRKNPFESDFSNEHRISEKYIIKHPIGKWSIKDKTIIEQRFYKTKYYNRYRNNLSITFPAIIKQLKITKSRNLSNELLCNTNNSSKPTYDYRLTIGNTISIAKKQVLKVAIQYRIEHLENKSIQKQILYIITSINIKL